MAVTARRHWAWVTCTAQIWPNRRQSECNHNFATIVSFNHEMDRRSLLSTAGGFALAAVSHVAHGERGNVRLPSSTEAIKKLLASAREQSTVTKDYDPRYVQIAYPGDDVARERGVCSDVIIRAFRAVDIDLQKMVHEGMAKNFVVYPRKWNLSRPDRNIDHRRVPNLMMYFSRLGKALPIIENAQHFQAGDIVAWDLGTGQTHIGIASDERRLLAQRSLIFHNIGAGVKHEDVLFKWRLIGHSRFW
jgi:uncharacterized protein